MPDNSCVHQGLREDCTLYNVHTSSGHETCVKVPTVNNNFNQSVTSVELSLSVSLLAKGIKSFTLNLFYKRRFN